MPQYRGLNQAKIAFSCETVTAGDVEYGVR